LQGRYETKRCKIEAIPNFILSGGTSKINIYAYSPSGEQVSFLCGDREKIQGSGGLLQDSILCDFSGDGLLDSWLALDGTICASVPIRVYTPATRDSRFCAITAHSLSDESLGVSRNFGATIYISNYHAGDAITWPCGDKNFSVDAGELILQSNKTGYVRLECSFPVDPGYLDSIPVHVGGDYCGDMISG
ncbi:MAG: hypothetical protein V1822_00495, partial [Candidatus Micrarchaeota archaeon]